MASVVVIGVGNAYRSDDSVGLVALQALRTSIHSGVKYVENTGDGAALLETWTQDSSVILLDAAISNAPAGTVLRFDALTQPLPTDFSFASSHTFGIAEAIRLARTLHQLPGWLILYTIVGKNFAIGETLSPEVEHGLRQAIPLLIQEIQALV